MEGDATSDAGTCCGNAHVCVKFGLHELHGKRLIPNDRLVVALDISDMFLAGPTVAQHAVNLADMPVFIRFLFQ